MPPARTADPSRPHGLPLKGVSRPSSRNFERHAAALGLTRDPCNLPAVQQRRPGVSRARLAGLAAADRAGAPADRSASC